MEGVQQGQLVTGGDLVLVCHVEQVLQAGTIQPTARAPLCWRHMSCRMLLLVQLVAVTGKQSHSFF